MKQQPPEPKGSGGCFLQSGRCSLFENLCFFSLRAEVSKHADKTKAIAKFLAIALVFALHLWYIMYKYEDRRLFEKVEVSQQSPKEAQLLALPLQMVIHFRMFI